MLNQTKLIHKQNKVKLSFLVNGWLYTWINPMKLIFDTNDFNVIWRHHETGLYMYTNILVAMTSTMK